MAERRIQDIEQALRDIPKQSIYAMFEEKATEVQKKTAFRILERVIMSKKSFTENESQTDSIDVGLFRGQEDKLNALAQQLKQEKREYSTLVETYNIRIQKMADQENEYKKQTRLLDELKGKINTLRAEKESELQNKDSELQATKESKDN